MIFGAVSSSISTVIVNVLRTSSTLFDAAISNSNVPPFDGVPVIAPVEELKLKPSGSDPLESVNPIGRVPVTLSSTLYSSPNIALSKLSVTKIGATGAI